jgi:predicted 3-demethylubiquinone-9 3-methyltransferase (glyoxalase superfamily)
MAKQKITPHLWFDKEAVDAAEFYSTVFPDSRVTMVTQIRDTPSGDCDIVGFEIMGYQFMAISAGPVFQINPSISFHVKCRTPEEVDAIWEKLAPGGTAMMELGAYPFSKRYGWIQDKYGVSWQVIHTEGDLSQRITPALMFTNDVCGRAEEALMTYASIFPASSAQVLARYEAGEEPDAAGSVKYAQLLLEGQEFVAMDSAWPHAFTFNEAISFIVSCSDQDEIDHYWDRLSAVPEAEQCGWIKDQFGVSWQITPENMDELMAANPAKTTPAMLAMKKIVIADLIAAGAG